MGGVIWSRLKPELDGLVTEAYLWRRHRGSETRGIVRESPSDEKRKEVFKGNQGGKLGRRKH